MTVTNFVADVDVVDGVEEGMTVNKIGPLATVSMGRMGSCRRSLNFKLRCVEQSHALMTMPKSMSRMKLMNLMKFLTCC